MSVLLRRYYQLLSQSLLNDMTIAAILGAFGDDGKAVINATKVYLNALAATDPTKAKALAALINEDPLLVVCLPISVGFTLPVRYVKTTSSGQYFSTGVRKTSSNAPREVSIVKFDKTSKRRWQGIGSSGGEFWGVLENDSYSAYDTISQNNISKRTILTKNYTGRNGQLYFFSGVGSQYEAAGCYRSESKVYVDDILVRDYVPFKRNGNMELLNLLDLTLCSRTGTLAEHFEYPDGTPWTPANS